MFVILALLALEAGNRLTTRAAPPAEAGPNLRRTTTVEVAERTKDAVVYISSKKIVAQRVVDPFFMQFDMGTRLYSSESLGSGFIIHRDGYIVTNNHVIDRARQIKITLLDGRQFDAELISADVEADLAILKINADKPLPTLELGDSSDLMIGEPTVAVGNPFGFSHTVSTGIVSALHRDIDASDERVKFRDLIQTDAAINPGNSGGPLLNVYGQVIGINTAIRSDAQNIGFAIQINRLRDLIPNLMNPAQVTKLDIPLKLKEVRKIIQPATVQTTVVRADDSAQVVSIAGQKPLNIVDAYATILKQQADKPFEVQLDGKSSAKIRPKAVPTPDAVVEAKKKLGITIEQVTPMLAERYGIIQENGLRITEIVHESIAERAGLQPGDVIVALGQFPISKLDDLGNLLQYLPEKGDVPIRIVRGRPGQQFRGWLHF
jgi:serine protease Do